MELTEKEKQMMTEGIIFSTSKPIPMLIKDGAEGGNYICNAFLLNSEMHLIIYDMSLPTDTQQISLDGNEIEYVAIGTYIQNQNGEFGRASSGSSLTLRTTNTDNIIYCEQHAHDWTWNKPYSLYSDKYEGLSMDTQAKLFFTDILKAYIVEPKESSDKESDSKLNTDIVNDTYKP